MLCTVVIQLALSGKWPEDAQAVRRVRAAFSIKIAGSLQTQCGLTTQAFPNHVDVLKDGFVFRLRVAYQREPALLRQCIMPDGLVKVVDCKEAQVLEKEIIHIPRITSYLHGYVWLMVLTQNVIMFGRHILNLYCIAVYTNSSLPLVLLHVWPNGGYQLT